MSFAAWRRVPEPGACPFCLMLATRGAVYKSDRTAGNGNKYHRHCHCRAELETDFDAREDVRIPPDDANQVIRFRNSSNDYAYDLSRYRNLGVTDPPKVPKSAPVQGGAPRPAPGPWVDDPAKVRASLRQLGIDDDRLDGYMDDFYITTNGIDVVELPRSGSDGRPMRSWRQRVKTARAETESAKAELQALSDEIDWYNEEIDRRITSLWAQGTSQRDLDDYRRGHKVDGKVDPEIARQRKLIREARSKMAIVKRNAAEYQQWLDDYPKVTVQPMTERDFALARQMAEDLDHVLARTPQWRRYQPDGTPRSYALQLDDEGCQSLGASAYAMIGGQRIAIASKTVLGRAPLTGRHGMRAGGVPGGRRTLAHEVGHTVDHDDNRQRDAIFERWQASRGKEWQAVSDYGQTEPAEMYAELFAEWMYGDRSNPAVAEFARVFKWAEKSDGGKWKGRQP